MGAWQSPEAWVWDQGPVCVPRSKKAGPHTLPDTERPREHDCTLFSHDACPAQGGLWGLHLGQRVQNRPLPSPDQVVTGGGDQRPRHTLDCTLPMCPLASAPPPLKPPGWVPEWPLQGSGGSGGWGGERAGLLPGSHGGDGSCGRVSWPISAWGSAAPESRPGERRQTRPALGVPSWIRFGSASAPRGTSWSALDEERPSRALTWGRGRRAWFPVSGPVLPLALPISLGSFAAGLSLTH